MGDWKKHLQAASGFLELGMMDEAAGEIEATVPKRKLIARPPCSPPHRRGYFSLGLWAGQLGMPVRNEWAGLVKILGG